jgi:hypothetical protein
MCQSINCRHVPKFPRGLRPEHILRDAAFGGPQDEGSGRFNVSWPTGLILRDRREAAIVSKDELGANCCDAHPNAR